MGMKTTIGIPKGLLYYQYGQLWERFLGYMGAKIIISKETSKETLDFGSILDDVCLPAKVYFGHVYELYQSVDYLFVPRIISVAEGQYTCPKIIGMPDLLRSNIPDLPPIIDINVNLRQHKWKLIQAVTSVGKLFGKNAPNSCYLWHKAWKNYHQEVYQKEDCTGQKRLALIGHPYIINDSLISMNVLDKLKKLGVEVITPEMVTVKQADQQARTLKKKLFWSYSHHMVGSALALMRSNPPVDGLIFLTSFACGPDALIGEMIKQQAEKLNVPCMMITVDEHTAEAGFITRLEAFTDMLSWRW